MRAKTVVAVALCFFGATPLMAQTDRPVAFDALMNNEAELAGVIVRVRVVLKDVRGVPKTSVRAWDQPVVLDLLVGARDSRRADPPSEQVLAQLKPGTVFTLTGTCESFMARRFTVRVEEIPEVRFALEKALFPSRNWIDC